MTSRDSEGPRRTPPGPTPQLDAVERLRRQLESRDAKSARRGTRPTTPRSTEPSHDLFGRDSADPYASASGWNYGPSTGHTDAYHAAPERGSTSDDRSTWRTADDASTPSGSRSNSDTADPDPETPGDDRGSSGRTPRQADASATALSAAGFTATGRAADSVVRLEEHSAGLDSGRVLRGNDESSIAPAAVIEGESNSVAKSGAPADKLAAARAALAEATAVAAANAAEAAAGSRRRGPRGGRAKAADSAEKESSGIEYEDADEGSAHRGGRRGGRNSVAVEGYPGVPETATAAVQDPDDDENSGPGSDDGHADRAGGRGRRGGRRRGAYVERDGGDGADSEDDDSRRRRGRRRRGRSGSVEESAGPAAPAGGGTEAQAKDICLRLLTDRARSRFELADRLADKGFNADVVKRVLDRLTEVGLIDDAAFAQQWVHSRHTYAGKGKKVLAEELRRKGIAPEHAEPALEAITAADELTRASDLVRRKAASLSPDLDRDKAVRRLVAMLARKGYNPGTAFEVVATELPPAPTPRRDTPPAGSRSTSGSNSTQPRRESPSDDTESATELIRAKLRTLSPNLDRETATRRLVGLLARRGYPSAIAYKVVTTELTAANFATRTPDHADETPVGAASSQPRRSKLASPPPAEVDDEHTRATELVRSKLRTLPRNLDRAKATQRLVGLLARRGFSAATAYSVVKAELAEADLSGD